MNIKGNTFGALKVISFSHKEELKCPNSIKRSYFWNCKCSCGNRVKAEQSQLVFGRKTNCGDILEHGKWSRKQEASLRKLYPTASWDKIKEAIPGKNQHAIQAYANLRGLRREPEVIGDTLRKGTLAPLLKELYQSYYWIGFIIADGWISHKTGQLVVMISAKDKEHLNKLASFLKTEAKDPYKNKHKKSSTFSNGKTYKSYKMIRIAVADPLAFDIIKKFKFQNNKTQNPPKINFNKLSENKFLALLAGYVDGDGSICKLKRKNKNINIRIQCHDSYLHFLKRLEKKLYEFLNYPLYESHANIDSLNYAKWTLTNSEVISRLKTKLDKLDIPLLQRKWDRITY